MSTLASFQNQVKPNWCPGCGDYAVQMALQQAAVKLNLEPHQLALVSGIGCSGRIGGYLYAYGMHTTHGRALPFAQGVKLANPELTVIACGGDGDGFAIGTAHTIHAMRRNVNITYILMDNHVYGLTKGQTSPRSDVGFKTKTFQGELVVQYLYGQISVGVTYGESRIILGAGLRYHKYADAILGERLKDPVVHADHAHHT